MRRDEWDEAIQGALERSAKKVEIDPLAKERIRFAIIREKKEEKRMRKTSWKKVVCAVGVLCMLCAGGAVAAGKIAGYSSGSSVMDDIHEYDEMKKDADKKLGYDVKMPEKFANGYTFSRGQVITVNANDTDGNHVDAFPELSVTYHKAGEADVFFSVSKWSEEEKRGTMLPINEELTAYYTVDHYRMVPPDYQVSEEEKAQMEKGELFVSYGTDQIEDKYIKSIDWEENGAVYRLMILDETVMDENDFLAMAKEVLAQ